MNSFSIILFAIVSCLAAISNGQNYIRLSRSDPNLALSQKTHLDQKDDDAASGNMDLLNHIKSPKGPVPRDLIESFPQQGKRYGGYYYDDFIDLPYPSLKMAQKRTNYVRLAKKRANFGKFSDLYNTIQYDEI